MALFNWRKKGGSAQGKSVETNPNNTDPMAMFKTDRKPYGYETLPMIDRIYISDADHAAKDQANETEVHHAIMQAYMNPGGEHDQEIIDTANRNMNENDREVGTRELLLNDATLKDVDNMYKANKAAARAYQRAQGVPEHDILDPESGFEISGDAIRRLKAGKPPKLSTDSPKE